MLRRLAAALLIAAAPGLAQADIALIAPDTPLGDSSNRIVNTRALSTALAQGIPLGAGTIFIGSASNFATSRVMSGDCSISIGGILTCTQAAGNFTVNGNLIVTGTGTFSGAASFTTAVYSGLATFNAGATVNGTLTVNGVIIDRYGGITINGAKQPTFASALPLTPGGIVYQDAFGLNVLPAPFPNQILTSRFVGQSPAWISTLMPANGGTGVANSANLTVSSALSIGRGQIQGEASATAASAGNVGELITNSASGVAITTSTGTVVTSVSLTAGDWDVVVNGGGTTTNAATTVSTVYVQSNNASGTMDFASDKLGSVVFTGAAPPNGTTFVAIAPPYRWALAATTTIYCNAYIIYGVSTLTASCAIRARRVR